MIGAWFYGRGADISGPVSGRELAHLAASGKVIPSDTIWREGHEAGVLAGKVKNLFANPYLGPPPSLSPVPEADAGLSQLTTIEPPGATAVESVAALAAPGPYEAGLPETQATGAPIPAESAPVPPVVQRPPPAKAARAVAGKGTVIVGQDGKTVKYRMKCVTCGKEDSSWKSISIPRGLARSSFFCPKCRKRQEVEIHGIH
jgi:hypothetical protein